MKIDSIGIMSKFSHPYINLGLRIVVGGIFILSAVSKLLTHTKFVEIVREYDLLPDVLASTYGNTLPWVELIVGVYLLLGIFRRPSVMVVFLMSISFMVANISSLVEGEEHCGDCFGDVITLTANQAVILDVFILLAALMLIFPSKAKQMLTLEHVINAIGRK